MKNQCARLFLAIRPLRRLFLSSEGTTSVTSAGIWQAVQSKSADHERQGSSTVGAYEFEHVRLLSALPFPPYSHFFAFIDPSRRTIGRRGRADTHGRFWRRLGTARRRSNASRIFRVLICRGNARDAQKIEQTGVSPIRECR